VAVCPRFAITGELEKYSLKKIVGVDFIAGYNYFYGEIDRPME
jgi:hypothetical protein